MAQSLEPTLTSEVLAALTRANAAFHEHWPGEATSRQPLHTVYGGAHLYKAGTTRKLGQLAIRALDAYAPDADSFRSALGRDWSNDFAATVYERVRAKLEHEAVEDFRIDFEDGFGVRPDAEEDGHAERTAQQVAVAMQEDLLPPFLGIRVKTLSDELAPRALRTLDLFISTLLTHSGGQLPPNFTITLPKVQHPAQVEAFAAVLEALERAHDLAPGTLKIELMIETTQSILDGEGRSALPLLLRACGGRCTGAHFGTYDYTASCNIAASEQSMRHPASDFAKHMMQVAYAGTGIHLSDGATTVMPIAPHRGALTEAQAEENRQAVHGAWRLAYDNVRHSLRGGFYQGWDLHPGQLPIRYAACFAFFLEGWPAASARLANFVDKAAQASLLGGMFDDAATGQGLLNTALRAYNSGAITLADLAATGLTLEEVQGRSFLRILDNRSRL